MMQWIVCFFFSSLAAQTTVVYNINTNTCSGTNMNCEGFVNAVGDEILWDLKDKDIISSDLKNITSKKSVSTTFVKQKFKAVYRLVPTQGPAKGMPIRVLFVKIPLATYNTLSLPQEVIQEIDQIKDTYNTVDTKWIMKVYRQFSSNNSTDQTVWTDVATLLLPANSKDPQMISIDPDGTATVTSKDKAGNPLDVVIALQKQY